MQGGSAMKEKSGVGYLVAAAVLCSIGGVCLRGIPWSPMATNGARNAIAACITGAFLRREGHRLRVNTAVLCGALSLALTTNLFVFSAKLAGAANAELLMYTAPVFVLLYMTFFKKQPPPRGAAATCVLVFAGVGCLVADGLGAGSLFGNVLGVLSGVSYAGVFLVNESPDGDALSAYFLGQLASAALGVPFLFLESDFSAVPLVSAALLGVFQLGLSFVLMARGLRTAPPMTASLVTAIEPLLTPIWLALLFGDRFTPLALCGMALVVGSVVRYNRRSVRS